MNIFEEKLTKSLVKVVEDRNIQRDVARQIADETYSKLKLIYDNVKESFDKRGIVIELNPLKYSRFHTNCITFYINSFEYMLVYRPNGKVYICDKKKENQIMKNEEEVYDFLIEMISLKVKFER